MSDDSTIQVGVRIHLKSKASETGRTTAVGTVYAKCRFVALPRPGDVIATANLTGVSVSTASIGMPMALKVDQVQHFTDGPEDLKPEVWVVSTMDAPANPESCLALVDALGERGWQIDGAIGSDHPFTSAVNIWKGTKL
jgi:hypothetical protein